jgi:N-acetylneuraminic acid mutarotase
VRTRLSNRCLIGTVAIVVGAALTAIAAPGPASAATGAVGAPPAARPAAEASLASSVPAAPAGSMPYRRACPRPTRPGYAACFALVRTDAASREGPLTAGATPQGYGPSDLQDAYALPSATAGKGATVAVVDAYDDPTAAADLAVYRHQFGLPPCTTANGCFRKINQAGGSVPPPRDAGWAIEISLDLDMVSAACPRCHILLVEANDDSIANLGAAVNEAVAQGAQYISNSYGTAGEDPAETTWDAEYYDHPGVVLTAAAGDGGYLDGGSGASFPAVSPHVVSVGGTTLTRDPAVPRGWAETAWADTGSGCSAYEPKPRWQHDRGCPMRTDNDVAAVADPDTGLAVFDTYQMQGWSVVGGTSAASPLIAAAYALAGRPVGGTYPPSYPYADPSALNNITSGNNSGGNGCSPTYLCQAGPGYNGPTGLGTPNGVAEFAAGPHGQITGTVRNAATGAPIAGVRVSIGLGTAVTGATGQYQASALTGSYTATASKTGYASQTVPRVTVLTGGTTRLDFTLRQLPVATVTGTVRDGSGHGWPLYARVAVAGTQTVTYTSPVTGRYQLTLPVTGSAYQLEVSAVYPGYHAAQAAVRLTTAGGRQDFSLTIDTFACTAPGYRAFYHGYTQDFNGSKAPAGWTVQNQDYDTTAQWAFGDPGHVGNYTGGSGGFAIANGLDVDTPGNDMQTGLFSPPINLTHDPTPVLQFDQDLSLALNGVVIDTFPVYSTFIEVSTDGGRTWDDVDDYYTTINGPDTAIYPLPQAAGKSKVEVMFWAGGNDGLTFAGSSWEIDDFFLGERNCEPVKGGLVVGQVRDRNTGSPVDGATVTSNGRPGYSAITESEPDDPAIGGGLYWLFADTGHSAVTASAAGYATERLHLAVTGNAVTSANLTLAAGRLAVTPGTIAVTEVMGAAAKTADLTVTNTGTASANFRLTGLAGTFTMAGQEAPAALAPAGARLEMIKGHFGTGLAARRPPARSPAARGAASGAPAPAPYSPPWVGIAHYLEDIYDNAAATDPATGLVYSVGGVDSYGNTVRDVFAYDPARKAWSQLPSMTYGREAPTAAVIGGKLYVTGGWDGADNLNQPALEIYDPATRLWSLGAPIPHAYYGASVAVLGGKMYVIGGCSADQVCASTDVQVYDPARNTWTEAAAYPRKISFLACGGISGKLYCAGGFDHDLQMGTTAAYVYDPQANTWSPVASMPADLWGGGYAAANGQLLISGGITRFDSELTNEGFAYNPLTNSWQSLPNSPEALYRGGSACGLYRIGGLDAYGNLYASAEQLPGYTECDGGAGVPWIAASPVQQTLGPGQSATVTLAVSTPPAVITQPGRYAATLRLDSGAPYPAPAVPVTLTANPPSTWGMLAGTVDGADCSGTRAPLPGATVQVDSAAGDWTLTTSSDGQYRMWMDERDSPLTLIAVASDYLAQTTTARISAGKTTTVPFTLERAGCG